MNLFETLLRCLGRLFPAVLRMSLAAGLLVPVAVLLRLVLKRAPKWTRCLLWALVAVRLLCPGLPKARVSLMPEGALRAVSAERIAEAADASLPAVEFETPGDRGANRADGEAQHAAVSHEAAPDAYLPLIWALGVLLMLAWALTSFLRLRRKTAAALPAGEGVFLCDEIDSPFILGVLRPRICIPSGLEEGRLAHVLAHEKAHLRRRDHWWKPLGFLLLSLHWFNPLLWLAWVLFCRDVELACDERSVRDLDREARADYALALLECSRPRRTVAVCPLAFGETGVKRRVKNVLNYRKPAVWVVLGAALVCILAAVFFLTDPKTEFKPRGGIVSAHWQQGAWAASLPPEAASELADLTNRYGSRRFPGEENVIDELSSTVTLLYDSGEKLVVHEQYYSGFSLRRGREDDYRTIVTWYDGEWKPIKTRRMSDRFDDALVEWKLRRTENGDYTVLSDVSADPPPAAKTLQERFPEYFGLSAFKGLELYVWQMAPGSWYCGLMEGTNRLKTEEELRSLPPATVQEMRTILAAYDVPEEEIFVIPFNHPLSSYAYPIDEALEKEARALFFGPPDPADLPLITVTCSGQTVVPWLHFRWAETWTEHGWLAADGIPLDFDLREHEDEVPALILAGELVPALREGVAGASDLQIYDMELNRLTRYDGEDLNAVYALPPGEYWCSFRITVRGKFIPEEGKFERSGQEAVIRLIVPEE